MKDEGLIFLVNENFTVSEDLSFLFSDEGYDVKYENEVDEANRLIREGLKYDVGIFEIDPKFFDGRRVLEASKITNPRIPVVVITDSVNKYDGNERYVLMPAKFSEYLNAVRGAREDTRR